MGRRRKRKKKKNPGTTDDDDSEMAVSSDWAVSDVDDEFSAVEGNALCLVCPGDHVKGLNLQEPDAR